MDESCLMYEWVTSHIESESSTGSPDHSASTAHTYDWVMSHSHESCLTHGVRCGTYVNESCHVYERLMSYDWLMSHGVSHVTYTNESCHVYEWVISFIRMDQVSHIWMIHVSHMDELCRMRKVSHQQAAQTIAHPLFTHMNESCLTHGVSHVPYMNESCHIYEWVMSRIWMSRVSHRK